MYKGRKCENAEFPDPRTPSSVTQGQISALGQSSSLNTFFEFRSGLQVDLGESFGISETVSSHSGTVAARLSK